jgi:hypothetical protein
VVHDVGYKIVVVVVAYHPASSDLIGDLTWHVRRLNNQLDILVCLSDVVVLSLVLVGRVIIVARLWDLLSVIVLVAEIPCMTLNVPLLGREGVQGRGSDAEGGVAVQRHGQEGPTAAADLHGSVGVVARDRRHSHTPRFQVPSPQKVHVQPRGQADCVCTSATPACSIPVLYLC